MTEKEFKSAKAQLRGGYVLGLESSSGRMQSLGRGVLLFNKTRTPEEIIAKIDAVTLDSVMEIANRVLCAKPSYTNAVDENNLPIVVETTKYSKTPVEAVYDANGKMISSESSLMNRAGDLYLANGKPSLGGYADVTDAGKLRVREANKKFQKYAGNLNSDYQLSWSNTFTYKDFSLYFLINGRIGGKVISLTEGYLDKWGASKRTGDARLHAEKNNIYTADNRHGMYLNDGRDMVAVEDYYTFVGSSDAGSYIYDATNFRLRELSLGYTFRNLFGDYKNLNDSFVCRNLFFLYKDSPVDPDVSLSTANGLGGIDVFNYPSARTFGLNIKVNL